MVAEAPPVWGDADEARLARLLAANYGGESLDAFIRRVSPRHPPPRHIKPIIDVWERTRHERVFACIEVPPRHAKTVTGLHALAWRMRRDPSLMNAFATFGDPFAASRSRICRTMYRGAGGTIARDANNLHEWMTPHGGGLLAHGYHGEWTGRGLTGVALIDDLYKDRPAAESILIREGVWEWFTDVLWTRLENASCIVQFTRWHDDDLIGRLLQGKFKGYHFEEIRLPAIAEEDDILGREVGEALWPERAEFSTPELHKIRDSIGPYSWASLYQQRPRPRGAELFVAPHRFSLAEWKPDGHRILLCCDPAATEDTRADFSAALVLAAKGFGEDMVVWVLHGWRNQVSVPKVARKLLELSNRYWRAPVAVESVAAFKGVPQMLRELEPRLRIREIKPVGDKFTRAQATAAAWNTGRILVPYDAELEWNPAHNQFERSLQVGDGVVLLVPTNEPIKLRPGVPAGVTWADELITECIKFTGVKDLEDDQVDALAHGFNTLWGIKQVQHGQRQNRLPFG